MVAGEQSGVAVDQPHSDPVDGAQFPIIEVFGPVVQGEGSMIGKKTHFIRFGGCDFRCSWCDTMYAVLPSEVRKNAKPMTVNDIVFELGGLGPVGATEWVTLSGGNPGLFDLDDLVETLHVLHFRVAVETQGSRYKAWMDKVDCLTISPKAPSAGMDLLQSKTPDVLEQVIICNPNANLKIVVANETDFRFAAEMHRRWPTVPMTVQPCNRSGEYEPRQQMEKYRWLAERTLTEYGMAGVLVLPQLHALAYGEERGK
jgi:7-carboxy-7-deazaguanine synthase